LNTINAMARPRVTPLSHLLELGVARISFGSALQRLAMTNLGQRLSAIAGGDDDWTS
jgi:2-methylisocitrate lyase-like PEP mutase family enzyme